MFAPLIRRLMSVVVPTALLLCLALPVAANTVTFDYETLGATYGAPAGHVPGDWVFAEDYADVYVDDFYIAGTPYFNFARIDAPFMGFGAGHILNLNNICATIDFNAAGDAGFEFLDLGGSVNIQVNGFGAVIEATDFPSLGTFMVAPGVTMSSTFVAVGGGIMGQVTLTGPVQTVRIGGQELWIDMADCANGLGSASGGPCDYAVDYETLPMGAVYGSSVGHSPGDWIFNEDGVDVYAEMFDAGTVMLFNYMEVVPNFGPFGPSQIMLVNNINQRFDITPLGITTAQVTFEYLDFGGTENLGINGSPLQVGDLHTFHGMTLGGVLVEVVTPGYGGGIFGRVTLTGDVQELVVGGQEFWLDDVCIEGAPAPDPCDKLVDHESLIVGDAWGAPYADSPGDWMFTEDGIPVYIGEYTAVTGGVFFNFCRVEPTFSGLGAGNVMMLNNVTNLYDIAASGIVSTAVTFEYIDLGGEENLEVNGAMLYVGDLHLAPVAIAPGVTCNVTTTPIPGGLRGFVTLTGQVDKLVVGGQEFWIDEICVYGGGGGGPVMWCDHLSDIESNPLGTSWGGSSGNVPGDVIFVEDSMVAGVDLFTDATGAVVFGNCRVDPAFAGFGTSQILTIANVGVTYDLSALGAIDEVRFDFFDGAGVENLVVNGSPLYVGDLSVAPTPIAPGVNLQVFTTPGPGYVTGTAILTGNVQNFLIGGQQFAIDNVCARLAGSTTDVQVTPRAKVELKPNYPNPFNPSTTLSFSMDRRGDVRLTIHDAAGRLVRMLIDGERPAGDHTAVWDGKDATGATAAAGVYFVRAATRDGVANRKIALIK